MASLQDALERTDRFLSQDLLRALRQVELRPVDFAVRASNTVLEEMTTAAVEIAYVHGSADALYRVGAFGQRLTMEVQLNAYRFVVIYRVPAARGVDLAGLEQRFARWQKGGRMSAGRSAGAIRSIPLRPARRGSKSTPTPRCPRISCGTSCTSSTGAPTSCR